MLANIDSATIIWCFALIEACGLITAVVARVGEGSHRQIVLHRLFMLFLVLNGAGAMLAVRIGPGLWLSSAATLGVMIVAAVCDFRQSDRAFTI
ncbi:MAG: hypothetical protein SGJ20_16540 [Planctomycetota bacterium]|nr:hypothetical protein [Planctomycetota bacterium]